MTTRELRRSAPNDRPDDPDDSVSRRKEKIHRKPRAGIFRAKYRRRNSTVRKRTASILLLAMVSVVLVIPFRLPVLQIVGNSMAPTLQHGDIVICRKTERIEPGDLMGFYAGNKLLIKRCIAGAGQTVDLTEKGNLLVDRNDQGPVPGQWETEYPCTVPEGQLFCLGDNRMISVDSRHEAVGLVSREQLLGKPFFRVWPLNRIGSLKMEGGG